jgi:EAL domain-containing protein (putative c-di-GMP-specific phosphodiesterase class I)
MTVRTSAGVVKAPADGQDADVLLRRAASALYFARRQGLPWHRYSSGDDQGAARRLRLAGGLARALRDGQITAYYQPNLNLATGRCDVLEALVRWEHPELGLVGPNEFVPLAERHGMGRDILELVLSQSLRQCVAWRRWGLARTVAVNASPRCLVTPGFVECVQAALARAGLASDALVLELTEDAYALGSPVAFEVVRELTGIGVRTAIDDFGTGYSSLSYLRQLPVSAVKLDRSFVTGLTCDGARDAVVAHAVQLSHELGLEVVAEGVESEPELQAARQYGCDSAQGYWICRPAPASQVTDWLAANRASGAAN